MQAEAPYWWRLTLSDSVHSYSNVRMTKISGSLIETDKIAQNGVICLTEYSIKANTAGQNTVVIERAEADERDVGEVLGNPVSVETADLDSDGWTDDDGDDSYEEEQEKNKTKKKTRILDYDKATRMCPACAQSLPDSMFKLSRSPAAPGANGSVAVVTARCLTCTVIGRNSPKDLECAACGLAKPRGTFSAAQQKKASTDRRCPGCIKSNRPSKWAAATAAEPYTKLIFGASPTKSAGVGGRADGALGVTQGTRVALASSLHVPVLSGDRIPKEPSVSSTSHRDRLVKGTIAWMPEWVVQVSTAEGWPAEMNNYAKRVCNSAKYISYFGPFLTCFSAPMPPHTRRVTCTSRCTCLSDAGWCLQSDDMPLWRGCRPFCPADRSGIRCLSKRCCARPSSMAGKPTCRGSSHQCRRALQMAVRPPQVGSPRTRRRRARRRKRRTRRTRRRRARPPTAVPRRTPTRGAATLTVFVAHHFSRVGCMHDSSHAP